MLLRKLWCCVGEGHKKIIWFYNPTAQSSFKRHEYIYHTFYSWLFCIVKKYVQAIGCARCASLSALLFPPYEQ